MQRLRYAASSTLLVTSLAIAVAANAVPATSGNSQRQSFLVAQADSSCTPDRSPIVAGANDPRRRAIFEKIVHDIKNAYSYRNGPGYIDEAGHFSKYYRLWTPDDFSRIDPAAVRGLYSMSTWGYYDLLAQVLPDYYRAHGGCAAFIRDLDTTYGSGHTNG